MPLTLAEIEELRAIKASHEASAVKPPARSVPERTAVTAERRKHDLPEGYNPSVKEVERYLRKWDSLDGYVEQEEALSLLFRSHPDFKENVSMPVVLVKCSTLNDFYSTRIYRIHDVAGKIVSIPDFDARLDAGDPGLVEEVADVNGRVNYSFATKYCSHHRPLKYPIFDRYVGDVLKTLKKRRPVDFSGFKTSDLRDYPKFRAWIDCFRRVYGLTSYSYKEIDRYLWQLGKDYFNPYN